MQYPFLSKNLFYKNVEAEIYQNFKNMLKKARAESENVFILYINKTLLKSHVIHHIQ